jgi:hypothetical protein
MSGLLRGAPPAERFGVFDLPQRTRGTKLASQVAVDRVTIEPHSASAVHRRDRPEPVSRVLAGDEWWDVRGGGRVLAGKGAFHGFATGGQALEFLSVQSPPILDT